MVLHTTSSGARGLLMKQYGLPMSKYESNTYANACEKTSIVIYQALSGFGFFAFLQNIPDFGIGSQISGSRECFLEQKLRFVIDFIAIKKINLTIIQKRVAPTTTAPTTTTMAWSPGLLALKVFLPSRSSKLR